MQLAWLKRLRHGIQHRLRPHLILRPRLIWSASTACGKRADNQDAVMLMDPSADDVAGLIQKRGVLAVIGDGIGGELGGAIASEVAVAAAFEAYYGEGNPAEVTTSADPIPWLQTALSAANAAVVRAANDTQLTRMGTTLVMAAVNVGSAVVAHVGDSRAYLRRHSGELVTLTEDHSIDIALPDSPGTYQSRLARALGERRNHEASFGVAAFRPGDYLLLCTDGLYRALTPEQLARVLGSGLPPHEAAHALVAQALACKDATDNITAVVVVFADSRIWVRWCVGSALRKIAKQLPRFCSPQCESKSVD